MLALGCWHLPEMCEAQPELLPIPRWGDVVFAALLVHGDLQKPQAVSLPPPDTKSTPLQ